MTIERLRAWSKALKTEALTVWYISKHRETPWYIRTLAVGLVAYAFSPIDLIPDFIPVLGYLDDAIILPIGVLIMFRLTPEHVISECRDQARAHIATGGGKPESQLGIILVAAGWVIGLILVGLLLRVLFT